MDYDYERYSAVTFPMVAYELERAYTDSPNIELDARFNYQEDNLYFFEKYVNLEYENPDGQLVSWYEFSQYRDLRDDEVAFLEDLQDRGLISELIIDEHMEEDYAETGRAASRPVKYHFTAKEGYIDALKACQEDADSKLYLDASLEFTGILSPLIHIGNKSIKLRGISTDSNAGKIIEYCSENSFDKVAKLEDIKNEIKIGGVTDLKTSLRGTVFYKGGTLSDFVDANASRILIKSKGRILFADFKSMEIAG